MMKRFCILLVIGAVILPGGAAPLAADEQVVTLGKHGALVLKVPEGWTMDVSGVSADVPPTLTFKPEVGDEFVLLVTPIWSELSGDPDFGSQDSVYRVVETTAQEAVIESVELELEIHEFGGDRTGYFFWSTDSRLADKDRIPSGEYLHLTQGAIMIGDLLCSFTILTNERPSGVIDAALLMLRNAAHRIAS